MADDPRMLILHPKKVWSLSSRILPANDMLTLQNSSFGVVHRFIYYLHMVEFRGLGAVLKVKELIR